jgi:hypothetical protein
MCAIGNAKGKLEKHQEQNIGVCDDLSNLVPFEAIILHAGLVASNSIDGVNALLFIKKSCSVGGVWKKDG